MTPMPRKRGPPSTLRIDTPVQNPHITLALGDGSASTLSSAASESDYSPLNNLPKARSSRNMKKLSLNLSAQSSSNSLLLPAEPPSAFAPTHPDLSRKERPRRPSIISLPATATPATLLRREEDGSPSVPYADGPIQILPGIWLGSEDNARDWKGLMERGIKSILNVAKEVSLPFDTHSGSQPLRSVVSTPDFKTTRDPNSTYYPPHAASGRPGMYYLKLQWSHGQQNLVKEGFKAAMAFTDAALERGEGVLVHCQCGISRSATLAIALVMRAAHERSQSVPPEVWALKGMQGAYNFVKEKSRWVGPNMSLIYELLEYEKVLRGGSSSPASSERSSVLADEEEWGRRRRLLDEAPSDVEEERESTFVMHEAQALDKAMEDRVVARKSSASSVASAGSGVGMGAAWRSRYSRKRTGSIASNMTSNSILSENLVEEDEERELLGVGGGFDDDQARISGPEVDESSATNSPDDEMEDVPHLVTLPPPKPAKPTKVPHLSRPPPSAPVWKTSFNLPPQPATATRSSFNLPSRPAGKPKRRPPPINLLPTVPPSPIALIVDDQSQHPAPAPIESKGKGNVPSVPIPRQNTQPRKAAPPPPLPLRQNLLKKVGSSQPTSTSVSTPSQTLFVFPPSPTTTAYTPSTMTLSTSTPIAFPTMSTPRVSTFRAQGRTRSFIGITAVRTPTTAFTKVDARGIIGFE
ncbi:hypothetical protein AX16_005489 [Volvariella volvacea WC 439]|nr:hypothetical protein AX16_005489 [Volvariella volvacea WC 439]